MASEKSVRVALVGAGVRGRVWASVCHRSTEVELVSVVDTNEGRAKSVIETLDGTRASTHKELSTAVAAHVPDAVIVASPPDTHHALVSAALAAGCHVLCEKPLSDEISETAELVDLADRRGLHLLVGMNFRYLSSSQRIREIAESKELGDPAHAQFTYVRHRDGRRDDLNDYPLTMAYPMLWEQSVHHFDLMRYCYGLEVESLVADSYRPPWSCYAGDCCVSVLLRFEGGLRLNYLGTWTAAWNAMDFRWRSDFGSGALIQRRQFDDLVRVPFRPELGQSGERFKSASDAEAMVVETLPPCEPFVDDTDGLLRELVAAVRGSATPVTTGRDHLRTLCVVQACIDSFETGGWVSMSELAKRLKISG